MLLITIIIFLVILSLLVFVHELGHFWTARRFGIKVDEFGFGLPPRIFGFQILKSEKIEKIAETEELEVDVSRTDSADGSTAIKEVVTREIKEIDRVATFRKRRWLWGNQAAEEAGGTVYSINWLPIGGFVKIKGENGEAKEEKDSFAAKSIGRRAIILAAGVLMNLVLCIVLLTIGFNLGLPGLSEEAARGAIISDPKIQVVEVIADSPAKNAGINAGDLFLSIDGQEFSTISGLRSYLQTKEGQAVAVKIKRGETELEKEVSIQKYQDTVGMGVALVDVATIRYPWYLSIWYGIKATFVWLVMIIVAFATVIKNLIVGVPIGIEVAGPVGIAALTGQAAKLGFVYVLQFTALLSLNLAIINILPFPALDGGRILFLVIEKIRGRAVIQKWENLAHNIGFALLMLLIVFVTYRDIVKYSGKIAGAFKGIVGL